MALLANGLETLEIGATAWRLIINSNLEKLYSKTEANTTFVAKAGSTMTGLLLLSADPTVALAAATKQYVDNKVIANDTYSKAELAAGQLDNRYYTEAESDVLFEPADATILKDSDIGSTVQAYDVDTLTKANSIKDLTDVLTTMTPIDGQVLTYDTANGWQAETSPAGVTDHTLLTNIGTNTHAQIDTHIADTTVHFTQASISITESQISNLGTTIVLDSDIGSTVQAYDVDTAKLDVLQTFTATQRSTITTDNDLSFNLAVANKFKCTPTALGTLTFTNLAAQSGMVILDNTGGFAISLAASIKAKSGVATTLSTAGVYLIGYDCDGANVYITVSAAMV